MFDELPNSKRVRFVEGSSALARAWLHLMPCEDDRVMSDDETRYALRRMKLSKFEEAQDPSSTCFQCDLTDHPTHHLTCSSTGPLRTRCHTSMLRAMAAGLRAIVTAVDPICKQDGAVVQGGRSIDGTRERGAETHPDSFCVV